ncbi:MAG TPA: ROK family protein [Acholeplasma sp.]|nr:ROK family protein [Acholeplasma sp.]
MNHFLVFDIGGTEIKYGVINQLGKLVFKSKMPSRGPQGGKYILDDIVTTSKALIPEYNPQGIAVSSAGVINSNTGEVLSATNTIINYIGMNVVDYLGSRLDLPVSIMNDVNSMALCETNLGAAKGSKFTVALTIGTGIGGAIVVNNQLIEGIGYNAGEFGLMKVESDNFETIAATSALVRNAQIIFGNQIQNGIDVFELYDQQNEDAIKLVNDFYFNLSEGIANLTFAFNPDVIVIGGGITGRPTFVDELSTHVMNRLTPHLRKYTTIKAAHYKNDAGMIGAFFHFINLFPQFNNL